MDVEQLQVQELQELQQHQEQQQQQHPHLSGDNVVDDDDDDDDDDEEEEEVTEVIVTTDVNGEPQITTTIKIGKAKWSSDEVHFSFFI